MAGVRMGVMEPSTYLFAAHSAGLQFSDASAGAVSGTNGPVMSLPGGGDKKHQKFSVFDKLMQSMRQT